MHGILKFSGRTSSRSANGVVHSRGDERESDRQEVGVGATPSESALSERAQRGQSTLPIDLIQAGQGQGEGSRQGQT